MKIKIRLIKWTDKDDILKWRNNIYSRKNSLINSVVTKNEHNKWYKKIISSHCHTSFILEVDAVKAGFINYEHKSNKRLYTSINLNPDFRGKNLGSKFLILTSRKLIINGFIGRFDAKIKNGNFASERSFIKAHYTKNRIYDNYSLYSYDVQNRELNMSKKNKKKDSFNRIIDQIEDIRSKNNTNWMDILRIAFEHSPKEASKVMSEIYNEDQKISLLAKKLKNSVKKS